MVKINDFSLQETTSLFINLPNYLRPFVFNATHHQISNQNLIEPKIITRLSGKINNFVEEKGEFILLRDDSYAYGAIFNIGHTNYQLLPIKPNVSILIKSRATKARPEVCGTTNQRSSKSSNNGFILCSPFNSCNPLTIRLLVLMPPDYIQYLSDEANGNSFTMNFIHAFITQSFGIALDNSEIDFVTVEIVSKHINFNYHSQTEPLSSIDLAELANISPNLNLQNNTDKTILLTGYVDYFGLRGRAECIGLNDHECVNAIVEAPHGLLPTWTFAHEVGHLYGARHDWPNDGSFWQDYCGHGYKFRTTGNEDRTVMNTLFADEIDDDNSQRVLYFSNPDLTIEYNGQSFPLGHPSRENNSLVLANVFCGLEGFQQNSSSKNRINSNTLSTFDLEIFPNPLVNILNIKSNIDISMLEVYDINNKIVFSNNNINQSKFTINTSNFNSGLYFIKVTTATTVHTKKIIK